MRLNLGCGADIRPGWVNVDLHGNPDKIWGLNQKPWPWDSDTVREVAMFNILEHLPDTIGVLKEIYRVCRDGASVSIVVPHPRHDDYISDPTHVSPITIRMFYLFSKKLCKEFSKDANTPLALIHDVDFEIANESYVIEKKWMNKMQSGNISEAELRDAVLDYNNVVKQIEITLKVCKE